MNGADDEDEHETFPNVDPDDLYDIDEVMARKESRRRKLKEDIKLRNVNGPGRSPDRTERNARNPAEHAQPSQHGDTVILSPKPVHFSLRSSDTTPLPAVAPIGDLPPPLHSTPTPSPNTPPNVGQAQLVPELPWDESFWTSKAGRKVNLDHQAEEECLRVLGPGEREEQEVDHGLSELLRVTQTDLQWMFGLLTYHNRN